MKSKYCQRYFILEIEQIYDGIYIPQPHHKARSKASPACFMLFQCPFITTHGNGKIHLFSFRSATGKSILIHFYPPGKWTLFTNFVVQELLWTLELSMYVTFGDKYNCNVLLCNFLTSRKYRKRRRYQVA